MDYIFDETVNTPLCEIMGRCKSDKGHLNINESWHNYTTFYYSIFKELQFKKLRIFELGLGTNNTSIPSNMGADGKPGASVYGWKEFFPNSEIFGADIDKNILFNNVERIQTFYCDQTCPDSINKLWSELPLEENFDIIIEDGLHTLKANICFFENSIQKLKPNGYYIIEDIHYSNEKKITNKIKEWSAIYKDCVFNYIKLKSNRNHYDNNLIVIHKSQT